MELDLSFQKKMGPIPYWKLTTVFILFIASFIIWQVWENQNRLYNDNLYMKRSIFTGVMFQVEFLKEAEILFVIVAFLLWHLLHALFSVFLSGALGSKYRSCLKRPLLI